MKWSRLDFAVMSCAVLSACAKPAVSANAEDAAAAAVATPAAVIAKAVHAKGPIELPVEVGSDAMKVERVFTGHRSRVKAKGNYVFKITLCNPKC